MPLANKPPDTRAKVAFLRRPGCYGHASQRVEVIETHMSWVFLAGSEVWKLKKPVRKPYLDFSTLALRERACRAEVRLNQRLAPGVYLGVVPLILDRQDRLRLGGPGRVADWLVHMRRLPERDMLDRRIAARAVPLPAVDEVARRLTAFYRSARPVRITADDYVRRLTDEVEFDRSILAEPARRLPAARVNRLSDAVLRLIDRAGPLLATRVGARRIVDGHGDLRPEHICLGPPVAIIDRLEFNSALREIDPVDELAFLGFECGRLGAPSVGRRFLSVYRRETRDPFPPGLVRLYVGSRALLRARLAIEHTGDHRALTGEHWVSRARAYLRLAEHAVLRRPATRGAR
jgi:aminoglycoside phosphotransferase family enzyme